MNSSFLRVHRLHIIFVIVFAILGVASIALLSAAPPQDGIEGETFAATGNVAIRTGDTTASGSSFVEFSPQITGGGGGGTTPPPSQNDPYPVVNPSLAIDFSTLSFPYTNNNGTYFSTLGAPARTMPWMQSTKLLWNQQLPDNTPLAQNSAVMVDVLDRLADQRPLLNGTTLYGYPGYIETARNAGYTLLVDSTRETVAPVEHDCRLVGRATQDWDGRSWFARPRSAIEQYYNNALPGRNGVPIPTNFSMTADDGDYHVTVFDYSTDTLFDFWAFAAQNIAQPDVPGHSSCWGGITRNFSTESSGTFPYPAGADAAGLAALGSVVTLDDLRRGVIDHVIGLSIPHAYNNDLPTQSPSYPGTRSDGRCSTTQYNNNFNDERRVVDAVGGIANCLREGQRLRFPANYDTSYITNPISRMIADAVRDYGMIIHDISDGFGLQAESTLAVTENGFGEDPWRHAATQSGLSPSSWYFADLITPIRWEDLQVLPVNWGMPSGYQYPCIDQSFWVFDDPTCERRIPLYAPF